MSKWKMVKVSSINNYRGKSVNPMKMPDCTFELYSVPSYGNDYPEIVTGVEIGSTKQTVQEGDVLLCKINPRINRVWSVTKYTKYPLIASTEWIVIRNNHVFSNYLVWCLKSEPFRNLMTTNVTGIGGSLTRVQPKQVKEYLIPLPPIETQKKIARTLDTAAELLVMRKQQFAQLDNLIKSTFYDMFGDPVANEKGWNKKELNDVCEKITDGEHITPQRVEKGIYLLSARNILNHEIKLNDVDFINENEYERISKRITPEENDVLISCSGSVGRVCRVKSNFKFQMVRSVAILKLNSKINPIFIEYMFDTDYLQNQILRSINQSSQANLFQGKIKKLEIISPSIAFQTQFASIVTKIEEQKALVHKAIDETQYLFNSLMSEYFD